MPQEIEKELVKCEQALYQMQVSYPEIARNAANARYAYDVAWAEAIDTITHRAIADGQKQPTVAVLEAEATKIVAEKMEAARIAEAELDIAKRHLSTSEAILSSVQTRSKLVQMEMSLAR